ncbi:hypothetical protein FF36_06212 [Frankia torreyi]|uniref:Uncharacterized protein n=1 Tax=Frankia torreyi TaxID=1856 RepID=A0A0D8B5N9_9ACTN|nr:hypothetical protein FF36_06212 [Frankia torreyi]KQM01921.1 hypothetical protein FF86_10937 [Frankia sp. CpI1-P]
MLLVDTPARRRRVLREENPSTPQRTAGVLAGPPAVPAPMAKRLSQVGSFFQQVIAAARQRSPRKLWPLRS